MSILDRLQTITGVTKPEMQTMLQKIQENTKRLEACPGPHDFLAFEPERGLMRKWRCSKCQGEVDNMYKVWYERGLKHGEAGAADRLGQVTRVIMSAPPGGQMKTHYKDAPCQCFGKAPSYPSARSNPHLPGCHLYKPENEPTATLDAADFHGRQA